MLARNIGIVSVLIALTLVSAFAADKPFDGASPVANAMGDKQGRPLKVFIMAGQSNMQGQSPVSTVPRMALSPESKPLHDKILDENGKPRVHTNVYMAAFSAKGGWGAAFVDKEKHGPLTVGYGNDLTSDSRLGPELGFGITMEEQVKEPILIIKTAWGGRSLIQDFRPPSAGIPPISEEDTAKLKASGEYEKELARRNEANGKYYRLMMEDINTVLADPGKYCAAYDPKKGYEIAGFAWFQGYNDMIRGKPYDFYTELLCQFIRDVRKDLKAPGMPFAIGVMGIGGNGDRSEGMLAFRKAMAAPAEMPEFKGNVIAVKTADFWDSEMEAAASKAGQADALYNATFGWTEDGTLDKSHIPSPGWVPVGTPGPEERTWRFVSFKRDAQDQYRALEPGEEGDERAFLDWTPDELKGWNQPGFDDSAWQKGLAPIGKGEMKKSRKPPYAARSRSPWGDGNLLLMRTTFELDRTDYVKYRLTIMTTGSYHVYLNGHKLHSYVWWRNGAEYRVVDLSEEQAQSAKKGTNVLAAYVNVNEGKGGERPNSVDLTIEGLTQEGKAHLDKVCGEICSPRERELAKGKGNQGYHYLGSAYTYSLIGKALAQAIFGMQNKEKEQP